MWLDNIQVNARLEDCDRTIHEHNNEVWLCFYKSLLINNDCDTRTTCDGAKKIVHKLSFDEYYFFERMITKFC